MPHSYRNTKTFEDTVELWIRDALRSGCTSLDSIVNELPGVYPTIIRDILERIISNTTAETYTKQSQPRLSLRQPIHIAHSIQLPIPHPLDYDWRFNDASVTYLIEKSRSLAEENAIILLGTPSIMRAAIESGNSEQYTLLEANLLMTACLIQADPTAQIIQCNIAKDELPNIKGSVIIADPPWYEDDIRVFLWVASELCNLGGSVLVSMPPVGTRPEIRNERERIVSWSEQLGLALIRIETGQLTYDTPPFEYNALQADGLTDVSHTWRRGDLAVFISQKKGFVSRPSLTPLNSQWEEFHIDGIRLRIRNSELKGFSDPTLKQLLPNDILTSVSRRDPIRQHVDVWSSGNRVFSCSGTTILRTIFHALLFGSEPVELVQNQIGRLLNVLEQELVIGARKQLEDLLMREKTDMSKLWEG